MILSRYHLIFLHVQKTAGNSVSELLLPYSDDHKTLNKHQDGKDRFGLRGPATKRKHALLADYHETLADDFHRYRVAIAIRDPFARAVSMYFSPHKWLVPQQGQWVRQSPYWNIDRFETLVDTMVSLTDFLMINGTVQIPDYTIRQDNLTVDLEHLLSDVGIQASVAGLPHINKSAANTALIETAIQDRRAREICDKRFSTDITFINQLYPTLSVQRRSA